MLSKRVTAISARGVNGLVRVMGVAGIPSIFRHSVLCTSHYMVYWMKLSYLLAFYNEKRKTHINYIILRRRHFFTVIDSKAVPYEVNVPQHQQLMAVLRIKWLSIAKRRIKPSIRSTKRPTQLSSSTSLVSGLSTEIFGLYQLVKMRHWRIGWRNDRKARALPAGFTGRICSTLWFRLPFDSVVIP